MKRSYPLLVILLSLLGRSALIAQRLPPRLMGTGEGHSVLIAADGALYSWGVWGESNATPTTNTLFQSNTPRRMPGGGKWRQVAAGSNYTLAIRQDGTLWGWGSNTAGQLGDGTCTSRYQPVQVGHAHTWRRISAYYNLSLGVRADGTLWAWGTNENGQLGLGKLTRCYTPRQVGTATNWTEVVAGFSHCVGLRADGTLWAWGDNSTAYFATSKAGMYLRTPRQIGTATTWRAVAVGDYHMAALRADGTLWTWGDNVHGPLGNNSQRSSRLPQQVGTATNWRQVSAGGQHTMALRTDGTLWAWGLDTDNWLGFDFSYLARRGYLAARHGVDPLQISDNPFIVRPLPVDSVRTWVAVESTSEHSLAVRTDGSVWIWGYNMSSQIGSLAPISPPPTQPDDPGGSPPMAPIHLPCLRALLPTHSPQRTPHGGPEVRR
jgi:alpha-tubulin suppressor-like RCC1 family protein